MSKKNNMNVWEFLHKNGYGLCVFTIILVYWYCKSNGIETP